MIFAGNPGRCLGPAMIRFIMLVLLTGGVFTSAYPQIYEPDGLRMPGDWNAWTNVTGMGGAFDLQKIQTGVPRWQTTFQYTGTTGSQYRENFAYDVPRRNQFMMNQAARIQVLRFFRNGLQN